MLEPRVVGHATLAGTPYVLLEKDDEPGFSTAPVFALPPRGDEISAGQA